jgi:dTDP-glucose pyrophosphorylase
MVDVVAAAAAALTALYFYDANVFAAFLHILPHVIGAYVYIMNYLLRRLP